MAGFFFQVKQTLMLSRFRSTLCATTLLVTASGLAVSQRGVQEWLTTADRSQLLNEHPVEYSKVSTGGANIVVDDSHRYQTIDGFGFAMTGGSAQLLMKMSAAKRRALLEEIFSTGPKAAGVSYLRVSIGASDMNDRVYTYDDMPDGKTDPELQHFSIAQDEADVIPVMKEVLSIAPHIQILASPWTPPSWMKTNGAPKGGSLKPEYYQAYAAYLVKYLQAMNAHGIAVNAITLQNEPLNPKNTPSLLMEAPEERAFLRDAFGPALRSAGLATKVILFDHNCNHPDYPMAILSDPAAAKFADGSGFHLYEGEISALTRVHDAYPQKNLYFTEQMVVEHTKDGVPEPVAYPVARVLIGAMRNWARNVLLWNLAADPSFGPHTANGGCPVCQGAITLDGDQATQNIAFYTVEHASRFVPAGSIRIDSTQPDEQLANVAWRTPAGKHVLLVANTSKAAKDLHVAAGKKRFDTSLDGGSVATFVW